MTTYLRDILPKDRDVKTIEYRCNGPVDYDCSEEDEEMLFGFCQWIGGELISGDGDNYYLGDVISKHIWVNDNYLVVWIEVEWSRSKKND